MKQKWILALLAAALLCSGAACGKSIEDLPTPASTLTNNTSDQTIPVSEPGIVETNPLLPSQTENWDDNDWDAWLTEGVDSDDYDNFDEDDWDDTDDIWDEDEWDNDIWIDEANQPHSSAYIYSPVRAFTSPVSANTDAKARSIFEAAHPGSTILAARPQKNGTVYAVYGLKENMKYKMLINASSGEIYLDEQIEVGGNSANSAQPAAGSVDETQARAIFSQQYPEANIVRVKNQGGKFFYIYGTNGSTHYEVKVRTMDGYVVFSHSYKAAENTPAEEPNTPDTPTNTTGPIDEAGARAIFSNRYPNAAIQKVKLEDNGTSYYIYGQDGTTRYKMKILTADGSIVMNRSNRSGNSQTDNSDSSGNNTTSSPTGGPIDEAGAIAIFTNTFGVAPQKVELQDGGQKYYLYANAGGANYKMNIRVSDGAILYSNGGGYYGGNNATTQTPQNNNTTTTTGGAVDAAGAQAIFESTFGVSPSKVQLQDGGKTYYMFAIAGNTKYIMKVRTSDGSIIMNKSIPMGGGQRGGRYYNG